MSKEIFNIESRYSSEIKFSSVNYDDFKGTSKNDFILFLIKKNFNLRSADLRSADLRSADLRSADLSSADLRSAYLSSADLINSKMPIYSKWSITFIALIPSPKLITDYEIKIGCKQKSIENWDIWFSSTDIFDTPRNTEKFVRIEAEYKATKTYLVHLCNELAKLEGKNE